MTKGIKAMQELGFIETTNIHKDNENVLRHFSRNSVEVISFNYSPSDDIIVFPYDILHQGPIRLNKDLLDAIQLNLDELELENDFFAFDLFEAFNETMTEIVNAIFNNNNKEEK